MNQEKHIQILEGSQAKQELQDSELILLTNRVNKLEVDEITGETRHNIALKMHETMGANINFVEIEENDPAFGPIEHMKWLRNLGHIAIAKDGEKTVGMAGFERCKTDPNTGRDVYEIRRLGVRSEYEGQGIGSQLHEVILNRVQAIDPKALILIETQNPTVSKQCQKMGYKQCSKEEGVRLKTDESETEETLAHYKQAGGEFFVYDSSAQGETSS